MVHGNAAAAARRKAEQTLLSRLRAAHAVDEARATPLDGTSSLETRVRERFIEHGVVRRSGEHRYYLDERRLVDYHARQHQQARLVLLGALVGVVCALLVAALVILTS
jgi:hypothetical protein